jgi:hypothetical protein
MHHRHHRCQYDTNFCPDYDNAYVNTTVLYLHKYPVVWLSSMYLGASGTRPFTAIRNEAVPKLQFLEQFP